MFLSELRNSTDVPTQEASNDSLPSTSSSTTKKEAVTLPSFQGNTSLIPSPYLTYSVWLNRWNSLISEYDAKCHIHFLLDRIDEAAQQKIVGCEQDYDGAINQVRLFLW